MTFATFVGLDLHKRYITACALAADGTLLGEVRRMPVAMDALLDFLTALPAPATIAVEATRAGVDAGARQDPNDGIVRRSSPTD